MVLVLPPSAPTRRMLRFEEALVPHRAEGHWGLPLLTFVAYEALGPRPRVPKFRRLGTRPRVPKFREGLGTRRRVPNSEQAEPAADQQHGAAPEAGATSSPMMPGPPPGGARPRRAGQGLN